MLIDCSNGRGPATLLAADARTAFAFKPQGPDGSLFFTKVLNPVFDRNMRLIDSLFPQIAVLCLEKCLRCEEVPFREIADALEKDDPLDLGAGMYRFNIEQFLVALALGMEPTAPWDGKCYLKEGCTVLARSGFEHAFSIYDTERFAGFLLEHARCRCEKVSRLEIEGDLETKERTDIILALGVSVDA